MKIVLETPRFILREFPETNAEICLEKVGMKFERLFEAYGTECLQYKKAT